MPTENIREQVLARVRAALQDRPRTQTLPDWDVEWIARQGAEIAEDFSDLFASRLRALNGVAVRSAAELAARLSAGGKRKGYCDPALLELFRAAAAGRLDVETEFDRYRVDEYSFAITRATGAIAETGTLIITDGDTPRRLAALAPWTHVVAVRRAQILPDVATAIHQLPADPNVVWISGPSKTADVEGILIEGVHGPGEQIAWLLD